MFTKEIKGDIPRWKDIPASWIRRINIAKITIVPQAIYRLNVTPMKLPMTFFTEQEQNILKFVWEKKKKKLEDSVFLTSDYTTQPQSSKQYGTETKTKNIDHWNRIESSEKTQTPFVNQSMKREV